MNFSTEVNFTLDANKISEQFVKIALQETKEEIHSYISKQCEQARGTLVANVNNALKKFSMEYINQEIDKSLHMTIANKINNQINDLYYCGRIHDPIKMSEKQLYDALTARVLTLNLLNNKDFLERVEKTIIDRITKDTVKRLGYKKLYNKIEEEVKQKIINIEANIEDEVIKHDS